MEAQNYRALVEYDGTDYAGFQMQPDRPTVQGQLENALQRAAQEFVRVHAAGRTDAGVHAYGQVITFRSSWRHGTPVLQRAMNALLPADVAIRQLSIALESFHARFSATSREYIYNLCIGSVRRPMVERYVNRLPRWPDVAAMERAAALLLGEHDFAAFGHAPSGDNTVRVVHRAEWRRRQGETDGWPGGLGDSGLSFRIEATGFLRGMVRRIVGTLLTVGMGALAVDDFAGVLVSTDLAQAAPPAPARGLCLWGVRYDLDGQGCYR